MCSAAGKTWQQSADAWCMSSMICQHSLSSTAWWNLLLAMIPKRCKVSGPTVNTNLTLLRILAWSFNQLFTGKWDPLDYQGRAFSPGSIEGMRANTYLAEAYRAMLWQEKCDCDWWYTNLSLPRFNSLHPCPFCPGSLSSDPWWDLVKTAPWFLHMFDAKAFSDANLARSPLFSIAGFSMWSLRCDMMHVKHLGVDQYFYGSVMQFLHEDLGIGVEQLPDEIRTRYPSDLPHACRFSLIIKTMFAHKDAFASLRGSAKACSHVVVSLLSLFEEMMDGHNVVHRQMRLGMLLLHRFEERVRDNKELHTWPATETRALLELVWDFESVNSYLRAHFGPRLLFHRTVKFHYLVHLAVSTRWANPMAGWCYHGESFMNLCETLHASCMRGRRGVNLDDSILTKYAHIHRLLALPVDSFVLRV